MHHLEIMLKSRFLFGMSGVGPEVPYYLQAPSDAIAVSPCTLSRKGLQEPRMARQMQRKQLIWEHEYLLHVEELELVHET